jgi:hypothetical protein
MNVSRRRLRFAPVLALSIAFAACSRDAEVVSTLKDLDSFSADLVNKVKNAPSPSQGIDAAQKYLDENRARLREKLQAVKEVRGFQITDETKKRVEASFTSDAAAVAGLELQYVTQAAMDAEFRTKVERLVNDYKSVLTD